MAVKKNENSQRRLKTTTPAVIPGWSRGEAPPASAEHIETSNKWETHMDGSTGMTIDATTTVANLTKTIEQMASVSQGNIEAILRSGQIWAAGCQAISKTMATTAQDHLDQTMSAWKALTTVKSLKEAMDVRVSLTQTSFQTAFAEAGKVTDATMRLAEQTMTPIIERFSLATEKVKRSSD